MKTRPSILVATLLVGCAPSLDERIDRFNYVLDIASEHFAEVPPSLVGSGVGRQLHCDEVDGQRFLSIGVRDTPVGPTTLDRIEYWRLHDFGCRGAIGYYDSYLEVTLTPRAEALTYDVHWDLATSFDCRLEATAVLRPPHFENLSITLCDEPFSSDELRFPMSELLDVGAEPGEPL